jgi:hypothetical protein
MLARNSLNSPQDPHIPDPNIALLIYTNDGRIPLHKPSCHDRKRMAIIFADIPISQRHIQAPKMHTTREPIADNIPAKLRTEIHAKHSPPIILVHHELLIVLPPLPEFVQDVDLYPALERGRGQVPGIIELEHTRDESLVGQELGY